MDKESQSTSKDVTKQEVQKEQNPTTLLEGQEKVTKPTQSSTTAQKQPGNIGTKQPKNAFSFENRKLPWIAVSVFCEHDDRIVGQKIKKITIKPKKVKTTLTKPTKPIKPSSTPKQSHQSRTIPLQDFLDRSLPPPAKSTRLSITPDENIIGVYWEKLCLCCGKWCKGREIGFIGDLGDVLREDLSTCTTGYLRDRISIIAGCEMLWSTQNPKEPLQSRIVRFNQDCSKYAEYMKFDTSKDETPPLTPPIAMLYMCAAIGSANTAFDIVSPEEGKSKKIWRWVLSEKRGDPQKKNESETPISSKANVPSSSTPASKSSHVSLPSSSTSSSKTIPSLKATLPKRSPKTFDLGEVIKIAQSIVSVCFEDVILVARPGVAVVNEGSTSTANQPGSAANILNNNLVNTQTKKGKELPNAENDSRSQPTKSINQASTTRNEHLDTKNRSQTDKTTTNATTTNLYEQD